MQGRDGCWRPGRHRLQLAGRPSATPKPDGYLYTTHGRVPALVRPPAARSPEPQPVSPTLSPPSPSAGGSVRGRVAMASQVSLGAARSSHYRSRPFSAAAAPDHRSRGGQAGARRADPPAQAWQRQQPAAAAAASAEPAPRGGREGRRSPERQCAAAILPKQPVAARAACEPGIRGQLWHAMAMATRPRTLPPALGEGGERVGRAGWGSGGRAAGGRTSAGMCPRTCCIYPSGLGVALGCPASCSLHAPGPQQPSRPYVPFLHGIVSSWYAIPRRPQNQIGVAEADS